MLTLLTTPVQLLDKNAPKFPSDSQIHACTPSSPPLPYHFFLATAFFLLEEKLTDTVSHKGKEGCIFWHMLYWPFAHFSMYQDLMFNIWGDEKKSHGQAKGSARSPLWFQENSRWWTSMKTAELRTERRSNIRPKRKSKTKRTNVLKK